MILRWSIILLYTLSIYLPAKGLPITYPVITGAEQLDLYLPKLKDKHIALVANQASLINNTHIVDALIAHGIIIKRILAPEHGFIGQRDAGELDKDMVDPRTGIEVVALYKASKKITPAMLEGIDIVVFDIQDVGVRFFTYISTLHYVMEGCAAYNKPLLLLDRPNPNAHYIDGPVLEKEVRSFLGIHPIPIVYGLTIGELATMINEEGWLENSLKCNLEIIPLKNYSHQTTYKLSVKPSPNLTNAQAVALYPSLGLFEGTIMSIGRGTDFPFQVVGYPDQKWGYFCFTPTSRPGMASKPKYQDRKCYGLDLSHVLPSSYINLSYLLHFYKLAKEQGIPFFQEGFDQHVGNKMLRQQIEAGFSEASIRVSWEPGLKKYKALREKYLRY